MQSLKKLMLYVAVPLAVVVALMNGCNVGQYQEPAFTVSDKLDGIELRDYAPALAAEVQVKGERKEAINQGFRLIADFIFGNNTAQTKVAMTTPVIQQATSEKIAMTTPVIQQGEGGAWVVQFIMPKEYTAETLPKPNNKEVKIKSIPARQMAVIRFSGSTKDDHKIAEKTVELQAYLVTKKLKAKGAPVLAFYDPPWTLPFLRRNEVMLEIRK
jgi:effector-binding domain-containing protein